MKLDAKKITYDSEKGGSAYYVQLTKTKGIKVMKKSYLSKGELLNSDEYLSILEEQQMYNHLHVRGCNFIPKCYQTMIITTSLHTRTYYQIGLVLQHLGYASLKDIGMTYNEWKKIAVEFESKLEGFNCLHADVHDSNILYYEGRFWLIDLEPKYTIVVE